jgi:hypothetical protein
MLENASEVILVPKNILFLKIQNFVQSFVECKVSLADGTYALCSQLFFFLVFISLSSTVFIYIFCLTQLMNKVIKIYPF